MESHTNPSPEPAAAAAPDPYAPPQDGAGQANPYAAPQVTALAPRVRKVYSLGQLVCGTFFGSLFCTAWMLRNNYKAFGKEAQATWAFWLVSATALLLMLVAMMLPGPFWGTIFSLISLFVVSNWFTSHMQRDFNLYTRKKGRRCSHWWALGVILLTLLVVLTVAFLVGAACELLGIPLPE